MLGWLGSNRLKYIGCSIYAEMPKLVDRDQYRKELLSQCFGLFADKGYATLTMRQIAQALGVSTGTLYHYFPSKKGMFEQLVEEMSRQDRQMAAIELEGAQTLAERLEVLGEFHAENQDYFIKQTYILVNFYQHLDPDEIRNSEVLKRADQRYRQIISDYLGIDDPAIVQFVLSLLNGLILEKLWGNETVSFAQQMTLLRRMLVAYLEHR